MEEVMSKTQPIGTKLSDSQRVILAAAAQRTDGSLLPFPENLTVECAVLNKVVETLYKRKLAEERRTINGAPEWRRDEDGRPLGLFITTSGLLALDVDNTEKEKPAQAPASMPRRPAMLKCDSASSMSACLPGRTVLLRKCSAFRCISIAAASSPGGGVILGGGSERRVNGMRA
jgi:hypothetical protein